LAASLAIDRKSDQRGADSRLLPASKQHHPGYFRILLAASGCRLRSGQGQRAPGGSRYPKGFDAGDYYCDSSYANVGEAVLDYLQAAGIRVRLSANRAGGFIKGYAEKSIQEHHSRRQRSVWQRRDQARGIRGQGRHLCHGNYPDIDGLFQQQAVEMDRSGARRF